MGRVVMVMIVVPLVAIVIVSRLVTVRSVDRGTLTVPVAMVMTVPVVMVMIVVPLVAIVIVSRLVTVRSVDRGTLTVPAVTAATVVRSAATVVPGKTVPPASLMPGTSAVPTALTASVHRKSIPMSRDANWTGQLPIRSTHLKTRVPAGLPSTWSWPAA
jgi:hypothetical protein